MGCASIRCGTAARAPDAAEAMKMTAVDLLALGVAVVVIPEPDGGAHRDHAGAIRAVGEALVRELDGLSGRSGAELREERRAKFLRIGG